MSDNAPTAGAPTRRGLGFGIAVLVICVLVALLAAWLAQPKGVTATALFEVRNEPTSITGRPDAILGTQDFEILKKTQIALLKSNFVLSSAIRNPGIGSLSILAGQRDPVEWLQDHLEIEFPQNGQILSISLTGSPPEDVVLLVDAVAEAYKKEVLGQEKQRQLNMHDMLDRSLQNLNADLKRKYEDYLDIAKGMGRSDVSIQQQLYMKRLERVEHELMQLEGQQLRAQLSGDAKESKFAEERIEQLTKRQAELLKDIEKQSERSGDLEMRAEELKQLQTIANEMSVRLEQMDIDAQAPERIRQLQPAVIDRQQLASQ